MCEHVRGGVFLYLLASAPIREPLGVVAEGAAGVGDRAEGGSVERYE